VLEHALNMLVPAILVVQTAVFVLVVVRMKDHVGAVQDRIVEYITPTGSEPSALSKSWEAASDEVARAIMARAKMTFGGLSSGVVRGEQAVEGDIAEDTARASSPIIDGLLSSYPSLRKTLRKNPALLDFAISKLASMAQANGVVPASGSAAGISGSSSSSKVSS